MPSNDIIEKFIHSVENEPHYETIDRFYADHAVIRENQGVPKVGKELLMNGEKEVFKKATSVHSKCIRPYFVSDSKVIIKWQFRFEWKNGTTSKIEEIAYQQWDGDKIVHEQFYFDPKQMIPSSSS